MPGLKVESKRSNCKVRSSQLGSIILHRPCPTISAPQWGSQGQAPPQADFAKNTNLQGPWGSGHWERQCLDDAVIIDKVHCLSKSVCHHGWQIGCGRQWLLLGNCPQHLGTCRHRWW
uniref:Uncharacterized protein n=1 Tax=Romanomermis culicivorax TaxID=13658 RepID=A0A915J8X8_ROMCU